MDFSLFLAIVAAAIGFFVIRRFRFDPENNETDSPPPSSLSPSSPPSSLSLSSPPISSSPLRSPSTLTPSSPPSSLSLSSDPSSSSHNWTHDDIFPSFRGEDIRNNFLSHVKKEFQRKGISYFNDNEIKRGESIGPELIRAIRESEIAIILLSKNYASSKWCLDELVEIMKCKEELGQTVIPVFYKVDPSDVKKPRGYFGKVFEKTCVGKSKEDTEKWRQALEKVATIAGYHSSDWVNEAAMIEEIATDVSNKLFSYVPSSDFDSFVGMRAHMEKMEPFLRLDSSEVRMIGIWGPSGIGKSTIARFLFNQHFRDFQLSVFMEDIKRDYPGPGFNRYNAQLQLQKKFLSLILNQKDVTIHHLGVVPDRLKYKKVLVVLDDVDQSAQLNALAKETSWFGSGSRVIVTTQDKRILKAHRINHIYEVGFPHDDEALEIFCINAFGQKSPYDGFRDLAREVTKLVGKLPLGLSVMGSYFKGLSKEEWEHELPRLRTRLNGDIENTLKFSYDVLCDEEQAVFLHIACFFNVERIDKVEAYLADKFVAVKSHLRVLADKSLISIKNSGLIIMHDLLARLGREIVRRQSPNERQFLVDDGDIRQVLHDNTLGSRSVLGINFQWVGHLKISDGAFERMSNVQFLRFRYLTPSFLLESSPYILESLNCLPQEVRLLHWRNFPLTSLPSNFNPEFLVEINMSNSNLEKLWEGNKPIRNLKWMDLSHSRNLKELPNLSTATSLRELDLRYCSSLLELPFSIGNLIHLKELNLDRSSLVELPSSIGNLHNLQKLSMRSCSKLKAIPLNINMKSLDELDLTYCSSLQSFPEISTNIRVLKIIGTAIQEIPPSIKSWSRLESLHVSYCENLGRCRHAFDLIKELHLSDKGIQEIAPWVKEMSGLEKLVINGCSNLQKLSSSIGSLTNLKNLDLSGCSSLVALPSSFGNLTNLENLYLFRCSSLVELPSSFGNLTNLMNLNLSTCSSLVELPSSTGNLHNLVTLNLKGCSKLKALPININMKYLDNVNLSGCSLLKSFPEISTNIRFLHLNGTAIEEIPTSIRSWPHLRSLSMSYSENLRKSQHAFDLITELHLSDTKIQEMAPWVKEMSCLHRLVIKGCTKLVSLPQLPNSIKFIDAENCESLERLDCLFYKTDFYELSFANCFKLNQEARDLILKTSTELWAVFPGEKVPTYFSHRATGSSVSMKLNAHFPTASLRFKACLLLVTKPDVVEPAAWYMRDISYCINDKLRDDSFYPQYPYTWYPLCPRSEHLVVIEFEETATSPELVFKFGFSEQNWEIKECGLRPLESLARSSC